MEVIMRLRHWSSVALLLLLMGTGAAVVHAIQSPAESPVLLPNKDGSFKFSVLGDFGVGDQKQFQLAEQMAALHGRFKYDLVVTVGDNILGSERPQDFQKKFEIPHKPLLDAGVKFYASVGNLDSRSQAGLLFPIRPNFPQAGFLGVSPALRISHQLSVSFSARATSG